MANEDKQNGIMSYSFGKPMAVEEEKAFSWYKDKIGMQQDTPPYRKNPEPLYKPSAWESMPDIKQVINMFSSKLLDPLGAIPSGQDLLAKYAKPAFSSQPLTDADASPLLSGTGVSSNDMPPLTPAEQAGVDVALEAQGNGLMSRPASDAAPTATESSALAAPVATPPAATTETSSVFSSVVESLYTSFTDGGKEGTEAHVGADDKNITLPAGILAEGLIYNGKAFKQGDAKVVGFDKTKLDTSGAYKVVNNKTIKRSDYTSDVDFSKAVLKGFEDAAKDAAGSDWDKIKDSAKGAILKIGWNKGESTLSGDTAKAVYKELAKDTPSASNLKGKIFTGSTVKDKGANIGLAKARADAWNMMRDAFTGVEITKITADNTGATTKFNYLDGKGNVVHTETTDRAPAIYNSKQSDGTNNELIEKNAKGEW